MLVSPPNVLTKEVDGVRMEPFEEVTVDVDNEFAGTVIEALTGDRKGMMMDMQENSADNKTRIIFEVPSRGLLGFGPEIATLTRGTAVVNHCFLEDRPFAGPMGDGMEKGKLVATETGKASTFALASVAERGTLFIEPGEMVYAGMVIGESTRPGDMDVNAVKAKALNNMRAAGKEEKVNLPPPKRWTVEELIGYMSEDEVIEVTPQSVRLRKMELDSGARERAARTKRKQQKALRGNKK
jgi:GTP-binding protein